MLKAKNVDGIQILEQEVEVIEDGGRSGWPETSDMSLTQYYYKLFISWREPP